MTPAARLRALLRQPDLIVAPGAYDAITVRLAEQAGFPAIYMTGAGTAAARGFPDYGLLTMNEMVDTARLMADMSGVPVVADADTGYGNELNVTRTVREFERSGVAAIHIEDQVAPKRCGHLDGKDIVPAAEFIAKIRAAVHARRDPDFVIIARTDARAVAGLDEAVARANAALDAGADMVFLEAVTSLEELAAVPRLVRGPCLLNLVPGGKTPEIDFEQARAMGYRMVILPGLLLVAVVSACDKVLQLVRGSGAPPPSSGGPALQQRFQRFGASQWDDLRARFMDRA